MIVLAAAGIVLVAAAAVRFGGRRFVAVVDGASMEPALRAGDRLLIRRCTPTEVRPGDIVVAREPQPVLPVERWVVKRAVAVPGDPVPRSLVPALRDAPGDVVPPGALVVLGDNPAASRDSRTYGYLGPEHLLGVVVRPLRRG